MEEEVILPDYVYLTIPANWLTVYHRCLKALAKYGVDALRDCNAACTGQNIYAIQCWNMFQSAIASRALGDDRAAELLIHYIETQLDIYKIKVDETEKIANDGRLYYAGVKDDEHKYFVVDPFTGVLYKHYFETGEDDGHRIDENGHLIQEDEEDN